MLIEVLISSLLVALIAVATFNGFDVTQKVTADERAHNQATALAQQDEERLRGMSASALQLVGTKVSTVTEGGTTYTITSTAQFVTAGANNEDTLTCATEKGTATYIQTTSSVTWNALGKRKAVSQSSNVRASTSTSLMVSVQNHNNEAVSGAKVEVFDPSTASIPTAEGTTSEAGCMTFGGLATGTTKIVVSKGEWVDHNGSKHPEKSVTITGTSLAEAKFTLDSPGAITANFVSNGVSVQGFTFFAYQTETPSGFVGGEANTAHTSATLTGLFPFVTPGKPPTPNKYAVYAGDCSKNDPVEVTKGEVKEDPTVEVKSGVTEPVNVEVPAVQATVYEGTSGSKGQPLTANLQTAMFINTECSSAPSYQHKVKLNASGEVEQEYQPYAKKLEFCIVALIGGKYYKYKSPTPFENKVKAGMKIGPFYMKESAGSGYATPSSSPLTCP